MESGLWAGWREGGATDRAAWVGDLGDDLAGLVAELKRDEQALASMAGSHEHELARLLAELAGQEDEQALAEMAGSHEHELARLLAQLAGQEEEDRRLLAAMVADGERALARLLDELDGQEHELARLLSQTLQAVGPGG